MANDTQDVKETVPASSTGTPEVVNQQGVAADQQPDNEQATAAGATDSEVSVQPQVIQPAQLDEVDEMGVPYKNRFMEYKRKYEETQRKQEEILSRLDSIAQQQSKPKYTKAQLLAALSHPDADAQTRAEAIQELERLNKEETSSTIREELNRVTKQQEEGMVRQQTLQSVMKHFPDAFAKDAQGNAAGWDQRSPLTQRIALYMQNPKISNDPEGLLAAAKMAYADLAASQSVVSSQKQQKLKQEVKTLQKKTLVEGGGTNANIQAITPLKKAVEASRSGDIKDANKAMREILKATGSIND